MATNREPLSQGSVMQNRRSGGRWSVGYIGAMAAAGIAAVLGVMMLLNNTGPMKTRDDDMSGKWERELEDRRQGKIAGVVFLLAGVAGCFLVYVESFKGAVRSLNPLAGRPESQVMLTLGPPTMTLSHDDGTTRHGWKVLWYSLVLAFKDGACVGMVAEGNLG